MMLNDEQESMLKEVAMPNVPPSEENHNNTCHKSIQAKI
jgi:hypothetical protein